MRSVKYYMSGRTENMAGENHPIQVALWHQLFGGGDYCGCGRAHSSEGGKIR